MSVNAVERVMWYSDTTSLPQEAPHNLPTQPSPTWPETGEIEFKNVIMSYRPGLPPVLKGL
jgi:ABC-type multidrug transport system fused ATPase/permease subunit